jgi:hypothetical protein
MSKSVLVMRAYLTPKNFREFEISGNASLYRLAEAINNYYGFLFDHPFGFYDNLDDHYESSEAYELFADMGEPVAEGAKSVERTKVAAAFDRDGKSFLFLFDYGDEWMFKVERLRESPLDAPRGFTRLIKSVGRSPKQYR